MAEAPIDFADERERELFGAAVLGESVRAFLTSHPVGKYLHHRAKVQIEQAQIDALKLDPDGWSWFRTRTKLRQVRQRAEVAKLFINWMADAILDGDRAAAELEETRR